MLTIKPDILRTFIVVAECGSLLEASEILGRTPSAISMSLKQFQKLLGVELFETDRKSTLTTLGQFVLEEGRRGLGGFEESAHTIQRYCQGRLGTVRMACVPSVATRLLPDVIESFQNSTPNVRLELRDSDSIMVAMSVRNGTVEFGIGSLSAYTKDLHTELLQEEPFGVVCRSDHPLTLQKAPATWQDLQVLPFINNSLCQTISNSDAQLIFSQASIHVHNAMTLNGLIIRGMGVTILPETAVQDHDDICFLPLADKQAIRQLYFMQHRQHRLSPASYAFKAAIASKVVPPQG